MLERLLQLAASVEEAIILLEQRGPHENARTVMRLRVIQGEFQNHAVRIGDIKGNAVSVIDHDRLEPGGV